MASVPNPRCRSMTTRRIKCVRPVVTLASGNTIRAMLVCEPLFSQSVSFILSPNPRHLNLDSSLVCRFREFFLVVIVSQSALALFSSWWLVGPDSSTRRRRGVGANEDATITTRQLLQNNTPLCILYNDTKFDPGRVPLSAPLNPSHIWTRSSPSLIWCYRESWSCFRPGSFAPQILTSQLLLIHTTYTWRHASQC